MITVPTCTSFQNINLIYSMTYVTQSLFFISSFYFFFLCTTARITQTSFKVLLTFCTTMQNYDKHEIFVYFLIKKCSFFVLNHKALCPVAVNYIFVNFSIQPVTSSSLLPVGLNSLRIIMIR